MEEKYKIQITIKAKSDFRKIIMYINNKLKEPEIAKKYLKVISKEIEKLEYNPKRFAIIDTKLNEQYEIRKLIIKNYIAFYRINEDKKIVSVERILYGASNWEEII